LPSEALREWREAPCGLLERILDARSYAAAKAIVDRAKSKQDIPATPMTALVQEIEFALAQAEIDAKRAAVHD
jgi:hypothetical protein